MRRMLLSPLLPLAALALVAGGCGSSAASPRATAARVVPRCPSAWLAGWQQLADQVHAPVYCPSWVPQPLEAKIGAQGSGRYVEPDRSYLIAFFWLDTTPTGGEEVHVNFRGYPGRASIPTCEDTLTVGGKTIHPKLPCFSDSHGRKRFGSTTVTVYTANQGADQWHVLYAWHHRGSLYAVSEHVAPPFTYDQVVANLNHMMRGLVLLQPAT